MGKIYCTECGAELDDNMKFCPECGTQVDDKEMTPNSNEVKGNEDISTNINVKEISAKSNNNKNSNTTKIFLGIAGVCIVLFILGIVLIGSSVTNSSEDTITDDTSDQSYIENIYGINFCIPGYFKEVKSVDYENDGYGGISCTRTYERPDGTGIAIIVGTSPDGWDLNNDPTAIDMTVNGHHGKLTSARDVFGYLSGDKLVVISGTSQEEIEEIIIE